MGYDHLPEEKRKVVWQLIDHCFGIDEYDIEYLGYEADRIAQILIENEIPLPDLRPFLNHMISEKLGDASQDNGGRDYRWWNRGG